MLTLLFLLIWKILCYFFMLLWVHLKKKAILVWGIEVLIPDYHDDDYGYSHPLEDHIDKNEWVYITRIVTKGYFDYLYKKGYRNEYNIKELLKKYPHPSKAEDSIIDNNMINF